MARIRTIKPEFPQSQSMGKVSRDARLLFIELWTIADDEGRTRAASRMLASLLFPYDDDAPSLIEGWLSELEGVGCIVRYTIEGDDYLEVCKWSDHQKIDRPSKSKFPPSRGLASPRERSSLDQGPRTKDQGPVPKAREPRAELTEPEPKPAVEPVAEQEPSPRSRQADRPDDVPEQVWADWLAHRRRKRATATATVIESLRTEAAAAGMSLADAMALTVANGWQGFRADWVAKSRDAPDGGFRNGKWQGVPRNIPASAYHDDGKDFG